MAENKPNIPDELWAQAEDYYLLRTQPQEQLALPMAMPDLAQVTYERQIDREARLAAEAAMLMPVFDSLYEHTLGLIPNMGVSTQDGSSFWPGWYKLESTVLPLCEVAEPGLVPGVALSTSAHRSWAPPFHNQPVRLMYQHVLEDTRLSPPRETYGQRSGIVFIPATGEYFGDTAQADFDAYAGVLSDIQRVLNFGPWGPEA